MTLTTRIKEIKDRLEKATPGPWRSKVEPDFHDDMVVENESIWVATMFKHKNRRENADFIAHTPTDLKLLIEICEKQKAYSNVISEGCTVFRLAVSRVENCRCSHESCEACVLSRAIINVVEVSIRVRSACDAMARGK